MGAGSAAAGVTAVGLGDDEGEEVAALKPSRKLGVGVVEFFWLALIALVSGIPSRAFSDFGITLIHVPHTNENMLLVHQYRNTAWQSIVAMRVISGKPISFQGKKRVMGV